MSDTGHHIQDSTPLIPLQRPEISAECPIQDIGLASAAEEAQRAPSIGCGCRR